MRESNWCIRNSQLIYDKICCLIDMGYDVAGIIFFIRIQINLPDFSIKSQLIEMLIQTLTYTFETTK